MHRKQHNTSIWQAMAIWKGLPRLTHSLFNIFGPTENHLIEVRKNWCMARPNPMRFFSSKALYSIHLTVAKWFDITNHMDKWNLTGAPAGGMSVKTSRDPDQWPKIGLQRCTMSHYRITLCDIILKPIQEKTPVSRLCSWPLWLTSEVQLIKKECTLDKTLV